MINFIKGIKTALTVGETLVKLKKDLQNKIKPLETYAFEPNQNNVDIAKNKENITKIKDDIIFIKNEIKKMKPNKKTKDNKWYDE
jgi:hypothetical protein